MSTVISAEIPDSLEAQVREEQEDDESRSAAVRRTIRKGLDADEIEDENHELRQKVEALRDELADRRERDERTIAVTYPAAIAVLGWYALALVVTIEPGEPVAVIGALLIAGAAAYGVINWYRGEA